MIQKKLTLLVALLVSGTYLLAQEEAPPRTAVHYVGVQANQLIRQLFSFGGSTPAFNNPYLLTYSVNSVDTGWGMNVGLGYTHNEFREGDAFNPRETTIKDFFFRIGVEKKIPIGKRWIFSSGLDIVRESQNNETELFGTSTTTKTTATGFGPRFTLNYNIHERIWLGTEATYYYKGINHNQTSSGAPPVNDKLKSFTFAVPAVLFLIIKF